MFSYLVGVVEMGNPGMQNSRKSIVKVSGTVSLTDTSLTWETDTVPAKGIIRQVRLRRTAGTAGTFALTIAESSSTAVTLRILQVDDTTATIHKTYESGVAYAVTTANSRVGFRQVDFGTMSIGVQRAGSAGSATVAYSMIIEVCD